MRATMKGAVPRSYPRAIASEDDQFPEVDGRSSEMMTLKRHLLNVARDAYVTVLIHGESGTGKEVVARAIHRHSPRNRGPFVVVNCAGLSPTLVEDELFGHMRGAFTGAISDRVGPFELAKGGTIFLDEIGELSPDLQLKLLRALQQRAVQRLGGVREVSFDVRVVAATNVDLEIEQGRGRFRSDLYYRLKVYEVRVPPLRSRGEADLRELVRVMLKRLSELRGRPIPVMSQAVWDPLLGYDWPGNVRELENTIERMIVAAGAGGDVLTREHLPDNFGAARRSAAIVSKVRSPRQWETLPSAADVLAAL
ncbi:MAG TPA: sigma-54 dependent transcriptional regulator, partial [Vicinamibacterales bacterium]|nr:sigma-54 dependent transcriptional regulator [Vicinamibacterales bacterium]